MGSIHGKNRGRKSRDTVSLIQGQWHQKLTLGDNLFSKDIHTTKMTGYHDFNTR